MTEKEKKAIVELNHFINLAPYWKQEKYTNNEINTYIKTILNLIEKQSNEIESLKEDNKKKSIVIIEYQDLYEKLVDKIKAKIEEVNNEKLNPAFIISSVEYKEVITKVLQSLLEKE